MNRLRSPAGEDRGRGPGAGTAIRLTAVALLAALLTACSVNRFQRQFEAGEYHEAMATFRSDSSLQHDADAVYRLGLLYALPASPYYDPSKARETFRGLLERHPYTHRRGEAEHLIALLEEIQSLGSRLIDLRTQLEQLKAIDLQESPPDTGRSR